MFITGPSLGGRAQIWKKRGGKNPPKINNKIHKRKLNLGRCVFTRLKGLETYCTFPDTQVKGSFRIFQIYWSLTVLWFPHQTICNLLPRIGTVFLSYCIFSSQKSNYYISSWKNKPFGDWNPGNMLSQTLRNPLWFISLEIRGTHNFLEYYSCLPKQDLAAFLHVLSVKTRVLQRAPCERASRCSSWGLQEDENKI